MVKTLYLIRHGETVGAEAKRYKGSIDVPLSERGAAQMKRIAEFIKEGIRIQASGAGGMGKEVSDSKVSSVFCSPLSRAVKSAEIIAGSFGTAPLVVNDLRERDFGVWEGMSFDEIRERHPDEFNAWAENPLKYSPMGGESTIEVRERVIDALGKILLIHSPEGKEARDRGGPDSVVIVAHGGVNRIILCEMLGIPLEHIFRIEQNYGCLNIVEFWDAYPVVKLLNGLLCDENVNQNKLEIGGYYEK